MTMHVCQIAEVNLRPIAGDKLSANAHSCVMDWLKQWTPEGNFKAVLAPTREECIETLRKDLEHTLLPTFLTSQRVTPDLFTFQVRWQECEGGNRFWVPLGLRLCTDFPVVPTSKES